MSTFNRELWEVRGRLPDYISEIQRSEIQAATHRVKSQLAFLAQMSGLNGPKYWPEELLTVESMRNLPQGAFPSISSVTSPQSRAVADRGFSVSNGRVLSLENPEAPEYQQPVTLYEGFEYRFEGHFPDKEFLEYDAISDQSFWFPGGSDFEVEIGGCHFEVKDWVREEGESDYEGFLGLHGSKGNEMAAHWGFDSCGIHGYDRSSLTIQPFVVRVDFSTLPPKINQGPPPEGFLGSYEPEIVVSHPEVSFSFSEGKLEIPYQEIPQDLIVYARYPSTLLETEGLGLEISKGELELQGSEDPDSGYFDLPLVTFWEIDFTAVFSPRVEDSSVPLRVTKFEDVQVWN